jgi:hypothetical protein
MAPLSYGRHRFPPEVIQHAIWLYLRFTLSYRDVEELLAERGLDGHTTAALSAAQPHRGTEGSNPFPSSGESVANSKRHIATITTGLSRPACQRGEQAHLSSGSHRSQLNEKVGVDS